MTLPGGKKFAPRDKRARRLVTMQVSFGLRTEQDTIFEGESTGLNEHGLAGRVNLVSGRLPSNLAGKRVSVRLDLPKETGFRRIEGEVLRFTTSWVPGYRYFLAVKFDRISREDVEYLKRFISWQEGRYFEEEKPPRQWYVHRTVENSTYGPLTAKEVESAVRAGALTEQDWIWSPFDGEWIPFTKEILSAEEAIPLAVESASGGSGLTPEVTKASGSTAADQRKTTDGKASAGRPTASRLLERRPPSSAGRWLRAFTVSVLLLFAALGAGIAYWTGWLDPSEPAQEYRRALESHDSGRYYLGIRFMDDLCRRFPKNRFARRDLLTRYLAESESLIDRSIANTMFEEPKRDNIGVPPPDRFVLCDFNRDGYTAREIAPPIFAWKSDPFDKETRIDIEYDPSDKIGSAGYSLKIDYHLRREPGIYAGLWVRFRGPDRPSLDLSDYSYLLFRIKGDGKARGYTRSLQVELRNEREIGIVTVNNIPNEWTQVKIPFAHFKGITQWDRLRSLLFVLDSSRVTDRDGVLLIDEIAAVKAR
ncbi:MAG: hypothetical protein D6679_09435 [Candidatus Hydrogenedentota bacterium]|nr:MAG: hypothetical protein D6679_09435 [Candidatus Hydrogenedentota bacterium]